MLEQMAGLASSFGFGLADVLFLGALFLCFLSISVWATCTVFWIFVVETFCSDSLLYLR